MTTGWRSTVPPPSRDEDYAATAPPAAGPRSPYRVRDGNSAAWRRAQIPAASGFGNARSVALVQSVMACGGTVGGLRLLSRAGCDRAREEQFNGMDRRLGMSVRWGLGYGLFGSTYGWGGWGGSIVMIEPDDRTAVAYVTNQMREPAGRQSGALRSIMAAYDGMQGGGFEKAIEPFKEFVQVPSGDDRLAVRPGYQGLPVAMRYDLDLRVLFAEPQQPLPDGWSGRAVLAASGHDVHLPFRVGRLCRGRWQGSAPHQGTGFYTGLVMD